MEFITCLQKFEANLWGHHLEVPKEVALNFIEGTDRRVVCKLNDQVTINSALMPARDYFFLLINKKLRDKLKLTIGSKVKVHLTKDASAYGLPMPEELATLLEQDEEGHKLFHALTPGKQRTLIYIVGKVKNFDSRMNKALAILFHLKENHGKIDFKQLNHTIKEYNQRQQLY